MSRKTKPIVENVTITTLANEGKAIAHVDEKVLFVPYCVPGDVVDVQITRNKHNFCEGKVITFRNYSSLRCEPKCQHFGYCGGCKWQMLPYSEQLKYKEQQVIDNLTRIGKVTLPKINPIIGSNQIYAYRNKLDFSFSDRKWLSWEEIEKQGGLEKADTQNGVGFHITGNFDKVIDIQTCHLMDDMNNEIRNTIRQYAVEHHFSFYNEHNHTGLLRNMIIRNNQRGEIMLIIIFGEAWQQTQHEDEVKALLAFLQQTFPQIISLQYGINTKFNDSLEGIDILVFSGENYLVEQMEDLQFRVHPKSFYQTNTHQAHELYKVVRHFAQLSGNEIVYDLYTGTGTIASFVAHQAKKVVGIEYVQEAIDDARENATFNNIDNMLFFAGDMKDILTTDFIAQYGQPDVVITDPPRAGMHPKVIETLLQILPKRIVYVSCNPATQARDVSLLATHYDITAVQPVDMFPHTHHIENVLLLEKRRA